MFALWVALSSYAICPPMQIELGDQANLNGAGNV